MAVAARGPGSPGPRAAPSALMLLLVGILVAATTADDPNHGVVFVYPTEGQIYNLMDVVDVTYTSPFPAPNLYAFCDGGNRTVSMQPVPGYNASVPYILNFTSATPCWFDLRPGTVPGNGANSPNFNIIGQERSSGNRVFGPSSSSLSSSTSSTSTAATSTTSSATSSTSSATTSSASQEANGSKTAVETSTLASVTAAGSQASSTASSTSSPVNGGSGGLSTAAAAGIGVGVAIGVLIVAGGVFAWFWRSRRRAEQAEGAVDTTYCGDDQWRSQGGRSEREAPKFLARPTDVHQEGYQSRNQKVLVAELSSAHTPAEIASSETQEAKYELPV